MFETTINEGVLRLQREGTHWLSTGWNGGFWRGETAYNVSVADGWDRTDLETYVSERRQRAGFEREGPTLLTGVDLEHARGARYGPVEVYTTAGVSNPAALPMVSDTVTGDTWVTSDEHPGTGTVNLLVGAARALDEAALSNMLSVAVEAKAATLLSETGFPGTTTDAVIVACDPSSEPIEFTGSATEVGAAVRACVRDAVRASLASRYPDGEYPPTVEAAEYGVSTDFHSEVFSP